MKAMTRTIALALMAMGALGLDASPVDGEMAKRAAVAWSAAGSVMGVRLGDRAVSVRSVSADESAFHAVRMADGCTVFLTSDTELAPVLGFTRSAEPDLSEGSCLREFLLGEVALRQGGLKPSVAVVKANAVASGNDNERLWNQLLGGANAASGTRLTVANSSGLTSLDDVRVEPLLQTKWGQRSVGGKSCFNYYLPDYPCGCGATALAQILRKFEYPASGPESAVFDCTTNGVPVALFTKGGDYDWSAMPDVPQASDGDAAFEAVGRLCYDCGVALGSDYAKGATGSIAFNVVTALRGYFGYANAWSYYDRNYAGAGSASLHNEQVRERVVYANLDAGLPVLFAIHDANGESGHAVVGDGYGYHAIGGVSNSFVHLNMGWNGNDDLWYCLPAFDASGISFAFLYQCIFNIMGEQSGEILSGRILASDGSAVPAATVRVYSGQDEVANAVSDAHGVYSFILPGNCAYRVTAVSGDGALAGSPADATALGVTKGVAFGAPAGYKWNVTVNTGVGNSWGNDIALTAPVARIGDRLFGRLDTALALARSGDAVEVLLPCELAKPVEIAADVRIAAAEEDETLCPVTLAAGAQLTVKSGARLELVNLRLDRGGLPTVLVESGAVLAIGSDADLGGVTIAGESGLSVIGVPTRPIAVQCPKTSAPGVAFATVADGVPALDAAAAALLRNAGDVELCGSELTTDGRVLRWDTVEVSAEEAVAVLEQNGASRRYASLRVLFPNVTGTARVSVLRDCALTNAVYVAEAVELSGANPGVKVDFGKYGSLCTVTDGVCAVTALGFGRAANAGVSPFKVAGGKLALGEGVLIGDIQVQSPVSDVKENAVIAVRGGEVEIVGGCVISNCTVRANSLGKGGLGGAVYLGDNSVCVLGEATIAGCSASRGGGVCADSAVSSKVRIVGPLFCRGNRSSRSGMAEDNICMQTYSAPEQLSFEAAAAEGAIGVNYYSSAKTKGNRLGDAFAVCADACDPSAIVNDFDSEGMMAVRDNGCLVWADASLPQPQPVEEADAVVRLTDLDAGSSAFYARFSDAAKVIGRDSIGRAAIELLRDDELDETVSFANGAEVVLQGGGHTVGRGGDFNVEVLGGSALVVSNTVFSGANGGILCMISVREGSLLDLCAGAQIRDVTGNGGRARGGVVVNCSTLYLRSGASIVNCTNLYVNLSDETGCGGGILADTSLVRICGGTVSGCSAFRAAGVCIANHSEISVDGDFTCVDNRRHDGLDSNLIVHDLESYLYVAGDISGDIRFREGIAADTNLIGRVGSDYSGDMKWAELASRFTHDTNGDTGVAVRRDDTEDIYFVWGSAVDPDGVYVDRSGVSYTLVRSGGRVVKCVPFKFTAIYENEGDLWRMTLAPAVAGCGYQLYATDDLLGSWDKSGPELKPTENGAFEFVRPEDGAARFWKVVGKDGMIYDE